MKNRIYIKEWLDMKPYKKQVPTDLYYLKLSNRILEELEATGADEFIARCVGKESVHPLCCMLASWVEDLVSGTNIYDSFIRCHRRLYGKPLPFFSTEEYFDGEPNQDDISFLVWYFISALDPDVLHSPHVEAFEDLGFDLIDLLGEAYEEAPENEDLCACYAADSGPEDFFRVRELMETVLVGTYLFWPDTGMRFGGEMIELLETDRDDERLPMMAYEVRTTLTGSMYTSLLAMPAREWAAEILGSEHPLYNDLRNISKRIVGFFFYKGEDDTSYRMEHIASGKRFDVVKYSFGPDARFDVVDDMWYMGITRWKGEWWFNGISINKEFDADFVLDQKDSVRDRAMVGFLDFDEKKGREMLEGQYQQFLKFNGGTPIAFMETGRINGFIREAMDDYNRSRNLSKKEIEEARSRSRKDGLRGSGDMGDSDFSDAPSEDALVFFNPKCGFEIAFGVNSAFLSESNPYYREESSEEDILFLMASDELSTELAHYCIEQGRDRIPYFTSGKGKAYLPDMDFLIRFFKADNYHTRPELTIVG